MASFGNISNLLKETIDVLNDYELTFDDVLWIGCDDYTISIEQFKELANNTYDKGYGAPKVAIDLKIVGKDWWLEREEYDGMEWWEFNTPPLKPKQNKKIDRLIFDKKVWGGWQTLRELNEEDKNND